MNEGGMLLLQLSFSNPSINTQEKNGNLSAERKSRKDGTGSKQNGRTNTLRRQPVEVRCSLN